MCRRFLLRPFLYLSGAFYAGFYRRVIGLNDRKGDVLRFVLNPNWRTVALSSQPDERYGSSENNDPDDPGYDYFLCGQDYLPLRVTHLQVFGLNDRVNVVVNDTNGGGWTYSLQPVSRLVATLCEDNVTACRGACACLHIRMMRLIKHGLMADTCANGALSAVL